jgi:molybdate transport system ATP-binding protein
LLLLDEPLASLDHARRQDILPWLERLRDELAIPMLYVTHAADEVARLADTLVVLDQGRVVAAGPVAEVLANVNTPVLLGEDVGALLVGTVQERDTAWHLARVDFESGSLWVRDNALPFGQRVRLRVLARDVSLATVKPEQTSIQNVLYMHIETIVPDVHPSQVLIRLRNDSTVLLSRITARSANVLGLHSGMPVWAQVKSVAVVQ